MKSEEVCDFPKITSLIMDGDLCFEDVNVCKHAKNGNIVNVDGYDQQYGSCISPVMMFDKN